MKCLTQALELWRGDPLADLAHLPYAAAAAARLEELRLGAVEDRVEAELAVGAEPASRVAELERLSTAHPLRERLRESLIKVLDADGRQTEALAAYESYRKLLAEELGADPGPDLRELHLRMLRGGSERQNARGNLRVPLTSFVAARPNSGTSVSSSGAAGW